jgi:hypothetical protein
MFLMCSVIGSRPILLARLGIIMALMSCGNQAANSDDDKAIAAE